MADGAIIGRRAAIGQANHTDGTATTVVTLDCSALPDGYYPGCARVGGGLSTGANAITAAIDFTLRVDNTSGLNSAVNVATVNYNGTGYTASLTESGTNMLLKVTAANGFRSVGHIELFGVEFALTVA